MYKNFNFCLCMLAFSFFWYPKYLNSFSQKKPCPTKIGSDILNSKKFTNIILTDRQTNLLKIIVVEVLRTIADNLQLDRIQNLVYCYVVQDFFIKPPKGNQLLDCTTFVWKFLLCMCMVMSCACFRANAFPLTTIVFVAHN